MDTPLQQSSSTDDTQAMRPTIAPTATAQALEAKMGQLHQSSIEIEIEAQAGTLGLGYVNFAKFTIPPQYLGIIDEATARRVKAVCFDFRPLVRIDLAVVDTQHPELAATIAALEHKHHVKVRLYLMSSASFDAAMAQYARVPKVIEIKTGVEITADDLARFPSTGTLADIGARLQEISLTDTVTYLMAAAIQQNATDIHVEAEEFNIKIRFRIDGMLHTIASLDKALWHQVASRMKLLAGLKINIEDRPQDGRVRIHLGEGKNIDVRVSALPTAYGESLAMRILRSDIGGVGFDELGLSQSLHEKLQREMHRSSGMILTCGPTGAGKTTTLYAVMIALNTAETKIITIEDPIEYELVGINQSQVRPDKGYTFADGLKSIVRQDPDVIMVGEMRDADTVDIAINAALTGHLVLSTLHTRNAAGVIPRLLSLQAKPFLLAPSLNAVIAQRLVRRTCPACKVETALTPETQARLVQALSKIPGGSAGSALSDTAVFYAGRGCAQCGGIGYKGRIGIFEMFSMSSELEQLVLAQELSEYKLEELLVKQGMITMLEDGIAKALKGVTTIEEVLRVTE